MQRSGDNRSTGFGLREGLALLVAMTVIYVAVRLSPGQSDLIYQDKNAKEWFESMLNGKSSREQYHAAISKLTTNFIPVLLEGCGKDQTWLAQKHMDLYESSAPFLKRMLPRPVFNMQLAGVLNDGAAYLGQFVDRKASFDLFKDLSGNSTVALRKLGLAYAFATGDGANGFNGLKKNLSDQEFIVRFYAACQVSSGPLVERAVPIYLDAVTNSARMRETFGQSNAYYWKKYAMNKLRNAAPEIADQHSQYVK